MMHGSAGMAGVAKRQEVARRGFNALLLAVTVLWCAPAPAQESIPEAVRRMEQTLREMDLRLWEMDLKLREMGQESRELNRRLQALEGSGADDTQRPEGASRRVGERFRDCDGTWCPELVVVPAGSFMMGSPEGEADRHGDKGSVHEVRIGKPVAVGVYEVKFGEWDACRRGGGCTHNPGDNGWGRGTRPVMNVSWADAQEYVRWLSGETGEGYRLMSESEWEYVARAGTGSRYWWGNDVVRDRANCRGCGSRWDGKETSPVGSFSANGFGVHDVLGNVWEWVEDCWHDNYAGAPRDGSAWTSGGDCRVRVLRGGSWSNKPRSVRSAYRSRYPSGGRNSSVGFRVARTVN